MKKQLVMAMAATMLMGTTAFANPVSDVYDKAQFDGDLRVRADVVDKNNVDQDLTQYRLRLNAGYKFNDNASLHVRFVNGENEFGKAEGTFRVDNFNVGFKADGADFLAGRQDYKVFSGLAFSMTDSGVTTDGTKYTHLEGLKASAKVGDFDTTAVVGNFSNNDNFDKQVVGMTVASKVDKIDVGAGYFVIDRHNDGPKIASAYAAAPIGQAKMFGEFVKSNANQDNKAWKLGVSYGDLVKTGDTQYAIEYGTVEQNAIFENFTDNYRNGGKYDRLTLEADKKLADNLIGKAYFENYSFKDNGPDEKTIRGELMIKF